MNESKLPKLLFLFIPVDTIRSKLGSTQLHSRDISYGDRFVSWESIEGVVCLRDISLTTTLTDNAVCLRFGGN